jgi:hypothetical protein
MSKAKLYAVGVIALAVLILAVRIGLSNFELLLVGLAALAFTLWAAKWAFVPRGDLPRNRVRHQRIRLYLRLHPGRGHATWWELHRQWSRTAAYRRVSRVRSS